MKGRILVVDDHRDTADPLVKLLGVFGYEARAAYDGKQAIEQAADFLPDMVFVDLAMPGMDGYETVAKMRRRHECSRAILIALSGYGRHEDRQRAFECGFDLHFTKPMSIDTLEECLTLLDPSAKESTTKKLLGLAAHWSKSKGA
jgi:CheY-like chemotaxis protein